MLDTDVLVIGGGVAGCMSAIPALEAGLQVVVCEKGKVLDHCGSVGCGVDHYLTVMDSGPEWDTPEFLIKHVPELTDGIVDMAVTSRVIHEMPRVLRRIEALGVNFKDPRLNDYYRLRSFGLPGTYHINFDGTEFKTNLKAALIIPDGKVNTPAYLVFQNYEKILKWNRSLRFGISVCTLAQKIKA